MTKFWMMVVAILALGTTTGCPDGDDCECDPSLCDPDSDTDSDADADADADATDNGADADADNDGSATTCGGGWLDPVTSLCWQDPFPDVGYHWDSAVAYCDNLSLAGHGPGSWHLPTIGELRSLVRGCPATETGGACGVTDTCLDVFAGCFTTACHGCAELGGPGAGGAYWPEGLSGWVGMYWSTSTAGWNARWCVNFSNGYVDSYGESAGGSLRCVRPGP